MNKKYLYIGLRILIVIASIILGIFAIYFIGKLTLPFIIGLLLALLINPLVDLLQNKAKMPRGLAVLAAIIIILGVISAIITLIVNEIIQGFSYLSKVIPEHYRNFTVYVENFYQTKIVPLYDNLLLMFRDLGERQKGTVLDSMQVVGEKLTSAASSLVQALGNGLYTFITKLPNFATVLIISLLATFFISKDWDKVNVALRNRVPKKIRLRINSIYEGLQQALFGFLKAQFKLTMITGAITLVGLFILRVEHALTISLIVWIVDFLPYVGAIIIFLPWVIYCFATGDFFLGIGLSIIYGLIVLQRQLLEPKILSSSIGISPLTTLITMYVGFKLIGVIGIGIGPIIFIVLKIFYQTGIFHDVWNFIMKGKTNPNS